MEGQKLKILQDSNPAKHGQKRSLNIALGLTTVYMVVEVIGGLLTGSLALLADAGHMLSDVGALGVALFALKLAERPPTSEKTYGYHRAEILAALANGLTLWLIAGLIFHEAYHRFSALPEVKGWGMLSVAAIGLGVNLGVAMILRKRASESLNLQGAFSHVLADTLGSIGAITAALIILAIGWHLADPLVSVLIAGLILYSSWDLVRGSVGILMEATPKEIKLDEVRTVLEQIPGVQEVHDLHVWCLTSGFYALSAHATVRNLSQGQQILEQARRSLKDRFQIGHMTLQLEKGPLQRETIIREIN
jgi:cobalt-zinc-cadmium efflux system protein